MRRKSNSVFQRMVFSYFVIFILFNTSISAAFAQATPPASGADATSTGVRDSLSSFGACQLTSLTPAEIQNLKNALYVDGNGFIGSQIGAGTAANGDREKVSDDNTLVVPNADQNEFAYKQDVPVSKISPNELPIRGHTSHGAFAFGIITEDTVRAGRCKDPNNLASCAVAEKALTLRNSDSDTLPEVQNVFSNLKKSFAEDGAKLSETESAQVQLQLEEQAIVAKPGEESIELSTYSRKSNPNLMNGISVNDGTFSASLETPCADSKCNIALYSMFDKYFNSWFSTEMVVSFGAPILLGQLKKMLRLAAVNASPESTAGKILGKIANIPKNASNLFFKKDVSVASAAFGGKDAVQAWKRKYIEGGNLGDVYGKLYSDRDLFSSGKSSAERAKEFLPDGLFGKINDFETRKKLATFVSKTSNYFDVASTNLKEVAKNLAIKGDDATGVRGFKHLIPRDQADLLDKAGAGIDVYYQAAAATASKADADKILVDYSVKVSKAMKDLDDSLNIDLAGDVFRTDPRAGMSGLFVKPISGGQPQELRTMEDFGKLQDSLISTSEKGLSPSFVGAPFQKVAADQGAIQLYEFVPDKYVEDLVIGKLERGEYAPDDFMSIGGLYVPASAKNIDVARNEILKGGKVVVYKSHFQESKINGGKFDAVEYSKKLTQGDFMASKFGTAARNSKALSNEFAQKDWTGGKYTSLLSKNAIEEERLIKDYFTTIPNAVKWTALPYIYVWAKKGFGFENASAFRLPKDYSQLKFEPGQEDIYKDAYVDFFANSGSNVGDLFTRMVSKLPWTSLVIEPAVQNFEPAKDAWDLINNTAGRSKVENLAMFVFGPKDCSTCSLTLSSPNPGVLSPSFISTQNLTSFFIEDPESKDAVDEGQVLSLFSHHTNVKGKIQNTPLDEINLVKDRKEEKTCQQMAEKLPLGFGAISKLLGDPSRTAAALAIAEDMTYFFGGYTGILASATQQLYIAPELNGCTDDKEGYFASLFAPKPEEGRASTDVGGNSTNNAMDAIRNFAKNAQRDFNGLSLTDKAVNEVASKVSEFTDSTQKNNTVTATLRMESSLINGTIKSPESLFFWFKEALEKAKYLKEGKTVLSSGDGRTVELNNETGQVLVNGKEVIGKGSADLERLHSINTAIPAVELPTRIGKLGLGDSNETIFIVTVNGELLITDQRVQNCLASSVLDQTGLPLSSDHLSDVFGRVQTVVTDSYPNVAFDSSRQMIVAEGLNRKMETGTAAQVRIGADATVSLNGKQVSDLGNLQSIQMQNGLLIYKPETNELLIWLKHHQNGILNQNDVQNLKGSLTDILNPSNACREPAINLAVETDSTTERTKLQGDLFNTSLSKQGPFQTFETDSRIIVLYSKKVNGECKDFFKVIDKDTGKVLVDKEISSIKQLEDGTIQIQSPDGDSHTLKFSQENGVPVLAYDGRAETLRTAQGQNGAFYYDPEKGLYYAENGQFIPLKDDFKKDGVLFSANPDGTVSGKPSTNFLIVPPTQGGEGLFNIPSLPLEPVYLAIVLVSLLGIFTFIRIRSTTDEF